MLKQYNRIKDMHRNSILFFRMGDFYEMFFEDAKIASGILDIALTSRDSTRKEDRIPMCGVPYHAAKSYIAKLLRAGKTEAICEQVEDPKLAKGIVRREVVRVITPGTVLEPELLDEDINNFLAAIHISGSGIGVAFTDVSTGEFRATERDGANTNELVVEELLRIGPSEFIFPASTMDSTLKACLDKNCPGVPLRPVEDWVFSLPQAISLITSHYGLHSLTGLGLDEMPLATSAVAAIIYYLKETYRASLQHLKRPGRMLRAWITHPLMSIERIASRQQAVAALVESNSQRLKIRNILKEVHDVERLLGRISGPGANARDVVALKDSLLRIQPLKEALRECDAALLQSISRSLDPLEQVTALVSSALVDAPPATTTEGNIIREGYSPELDSLKSMVRDGKDWIARLQKQEIRRTGINSLKVAYNRVFGYYIEVTKPNLSLVPPDYIRKQTLVNAERFVTPELKERESAILGAEEKMISLEAELFHSIRKQVCAHAEQIQLNAELVAESDVLQSLAHVAATSDYCRPDLANSFEIDIREGRHPVLEQLNLGQAFVPNDTQIDERGTILVITGPNMAGKSTYLRQVALIVLMAQMGSFVPARCAKIGIVDRIFTRVGASDNLVSGESTFMVEMNETANILNNATRASMIILDEIGRGTSTYDGMSIAWAVAEHIHNDLGAKTVFATHYHELTDLAKELKQIRNLNVAVREWNNQVVFLYKVVEGSSDHSYGIHVAKLAGLPSAVISRARQVLNELEKANPRRRLRRSADSNQLQLFAPVAQSPVEDELRKLDINQLTPLEALAKLAEFKKKVSH
ncbi:MAG: DNA mismatch repair protein MutS [Candidatus Lindowbacteria bacterium]|nr:DNA mismatch repair protein MutS [Candidatus Lindowbacteria bacterium]